MCGQELMRLNTFLPRSLGVATEATAVRLGKPGEACIEIPATARFPAREAMFSDEVYGNDMNDTQCKTGKGR